ncbi:hypothetical protein GCM10010244_38570 [Streptomyces coeruleorubidus]|nr:hypothetical protein GCM10010244_38570 [Streptomyces bellus]
MQSPPSAETHPADEPVQGRCRRQRESWKGAIVSAKRLGAGLADRALESVEQSVADQLGAAAPVDRRTAAR